MKDRNPNPAHSVGDGAQKEQHNNEKEESYIETTKKDRHALDADINDEDYLKRKWHKIATDFRNEYKVDVDDETFKGENFAEVLESLGKKTGKTSEEIKGEIHNWKDREGEKRD